MGYSFEGGISTVEGRFQECKGGENLYSAFPPSHDPKLPLLSWPSRCQVHHTDLSMGDCLQNLRRRGDVITKTTFYLSRGTTHALTSTHWAQGMIEPQNIRNGAPNIRNLHLQTGKNKIPHIYTSELQLQCNSLHSCQLIEALQRPDSKLQALGSMFREETKSSPMGLPLPNASRCLGTW